LLPAAVTEKAKRRAQSLDFIDSLVMTSSAWMSKMRARTMRLTYPRALKQPITDPPARADVSLRTATAYFVRGADS
jgi:hypothetical protein